MARERERAMKQHGLVVTAANEDSLPLQAERLVLNKWKGTSLQMVLQSEYPQ